MVLLGVGNAFVWAPNSATATRNLPIQQAGAGAGIYNATRQVGAVLGSAAIAVLLDSRLAAQGLPSFSGEGGGAGACRRGRAEKFSDAMAQTDAAPAGGPACSAWSPCCSSSARGTPATPPRPSPAGRGARSAADEPRPLARRSLLDQRALEPAPARERRVRRRATCPAARRFSQASTTRAAMPASPALPQARGS